MCDSTQTDSECGLLGAELGYLPGYELPRCTDGELLPGQQGRRGVLIVG